MLVLFISTSKLMLTLHAWLAGLSRKGVWNNICYVRYRMTEAKMWHGMDICNTSKMYMCSVLSRYVMCYLYQLIHVVLCFVLLRSFRDFVDFSTCSSFRILGIVFSLLFLAFE